MSDIIKLPWDIEDIPEKVPLGDFVRTIVVQWLNEFLIHFSQTLNPVGTVTESSEWNIEDLFNLLNEEGDTNDS